MKTKITARYSKWLPIAMAVMGTGMSYPQAASHAQEAGPRLRYQVESHSKPCPTDQKCDERIPEKPDDLPVLTVDGDKSDNGQKSTSANDATGKVSPTPPEAPTVMIDSKEYRATPGRMSTKPKIGESASPLPEDFKETSSPFTKPTQEISDTDSSPALAMSVTALGFFVGLVSSVGMLKRRFAQPLEKRPYGDRSKSASDSTADSSAAWMPEGVKPETFQLQSALRNKLLTEEDYRDLRSKYLVAGNFGFSMLLPIELGLGYLMAGQGFFIYLGLSVINVVLTFTLTTYALDRRHQFRAEYRTLIIQNLQPAVTVKESVPAATEEAAPTYSAEDIARAVQLIVGVSSTLHAQGAVGEVAARAETAAQPAEAAAARAETAAEAEAGEDEEPWNLRGEL